MRKRSVHNTAAGGKRIEHKKGLKNKNKQKQADGAGFALKRGTELLPKKSEVSNELVNGYCQAENKEDDPEGNFRRFVGQMSGMRANAVFKGIETVDVCLHQMRTPSAALCRQTFETAV
jgi:hypothetical protein